MSNEMPRFVIISAIEEARGTIAEGWRQFNATQDIDRLLAISEYIWDAQDAVRNMEQLLNTTKED